MSSNDPVTETTVLLAKPAKVPHVAAATSSLVFAGAGKHHIDDKKTLHVQSHAGGNIASFPDGTYLGVFHGNPDITPGDGSDS